MKGQGGGGTAKGGGKSRSGGGTVVIKSTEVKKDKKCQDVEDSGHILLLRSALFESNGKDKDVTSGISSSLMKYDRNGVDVSVEFATKLSEVILIITLIIRATINSSDNNDSDN